MGHSYTVVVGNIGEVHHGHNLLVARRTFRSYRRASIDGCGRAGGEPVTLFKDNDVIDAYEPVHLGESADEDNPR